MYTISINRHELQIGGSSEQPAHLPVSVHSLDAAAYESANLRAIVENLLQDTSEEAQIYRLHAPNGERLWAVFCVAFDKIEEAAGGAVQHSPTKSWLAMQRRGLWDMPKGKCEKGETIEETALREVEEETGLKKLHIRRPLGATYHVFEKISRKNGEKKLVLKVSHWFEMETTQIETQPQMEEDIERIEWLSLADFMQREPIYKNIFELLRRLEAQA